MNRPVAASAVLALAIGLAPPAAADASFDCIINPAVTVRVSSPVAGLIDRVMVEPGDLVEAGDVIARLRSDVERTTVQLMREQAESTAEIEAQQARLTLAESRLGRTERLVQQRIKSEDELETVRSEMEVISRELAIAEMRRRIAQLELDRATKQLAQRTIRSPVDGVVTERTLYSGEFLHQEAHVATIAQIDPLIVEAFLPVRLADRIKAGMPVIIVPHEPLEGSFAGTIVVADRVFDAASGTFGIRIELPNPDLTIPAGHRCTVELPVVAGG